MLQKKIKGARSCWHHIFVPGFNGWTTIHINECDHARMMAMADDNNRLLNAVAKVAAARIVAAGVRSGESFGKRVRFKMEELLATTSDPYTIIGFAPLPEYQLKSSQTGQSAAQ